MMNQLFMLLLFDRRNWCTCIPQCTSPTTTSMHSSTSHIQHHSTPPSSSRPAHLPRPQLAHH